MTFDELLVEVLALLQHEGRVSYGALKRRFNLDDPCLDDLKTELIDARGVAVDVDGRLIMWRRPTSAPPAHAPAPQAPPLPVPPLTEEAERRQLTVMFCDLVDSTGLAAERDPEDLREVIQAYQQTCAEVIQQFDGHIAQYLGDGLLVYFGYPQAHEDDAQRAVRAGLGIVDALGVTRKLLQQREPPIQLAVRVGIHTGLVVVGSVGGRGRQEQLALGEAPNIAARIQSLARPDTVVISEATLHLVQGHFTCHAIGPQALRGVPTAIPVYQVLGESGVQGRLDVAAARGLTPLVGREAEVALLLARWAGVKDGQGHIVALSGEAGIGKSRLVQVLKDHIADEPHTRLECRCSPYYQHTTLYPLINMMERVLHFQRDEAPDTKLEKLERALAQYRLPLEEAVPLFATVLSLPLPEARYAPLPITPEQQKQKTLEALLAIVVELAERHPVLLILEDLQWADTSTVEFLQLLITQGPTAATLTVVTYRSDFQAPWELGADLTPLSVQRLSAAHVEAMVTRVTGGKPLPREVLQRVVTNTDGVPLFVEELTKSIVESGVLHEAEEHYELTGPLPTLAIPTTLHDALMARLDRLNTVKSVAQLGATLGRTFAYDLLQAVTPLDEATLQHGLRQLVAAELLYQRGVPPEATYHFKHALLQEAAYQSLLRSTRKQYHQRIAEVLDTRFPNTADSQPELLAHHYTAAGDLPKAVHYGRRAAARAHRLGQFQDAVTLFEQARAWLLQLPEERAQQEALIDLNLESLWPLHFLGRLERMLFICQEAETMAHALSDRVRLGKVCVGYGISYGFTGEYKTAEPYFLRALEYLNGTAENASLTTARYALAMAYNAQGQWQQAAPLFAESIRAQEEEQSQTKEIDWGVGFLAYAYGCTALGYNLALQGRVAEAKDALLKGYTPALERLSNLFTKIYCVLWHSRMAVLLGEDHGALARAEQLLTLTAETDSPSMRFFAHVAHSTALIAVGHFAAAREACTQALQAIAGTPHHDGLGEVYFNLAWASLELGDRPAAERYHQEGKRRTARFALLQGRLLAAGRLPDFVQAEACLIQSVQADEATGAVVLAAQTRFYLAQMLAAKGEVPRAQVLLAAVRDQFDAWGISFWQRKSAQALMAFGASKGS
jgi:class 3 adenylate cyclase/tetratricopeptide (TPR) repeat protein